VSNSILNYKKVVSTQEIAFSFASEARTSLLWIVADEQEQGRGRHERTWHSPKGNLHASLLLIEPCAQSYVPQLSFVAGIALHEAIKPLLKGKNPALKWPNDLLVNGEKLAGILVEAKYIEGKMAVVIGFGVNTAYAPVNTPYPCTSLGLSVSDGRDILFKNLNTTMMTYLDLWQAGSGFSAIRQQWIERAMARDTSFSLRKDKTVIEGSFEGINEHGHLLLRTGQGIETHDSGDVFLSSP
jgi:BirA family transcriptional regulator, biotin operon repressor / biotin---[acetyl-CoA-carboxylase] ligase